MAKLGGRNELLDAKLQKLQIRSQLYSAEDFQKKAAEFRYSVFLKYLCYDKPYF